MLLVGLYGEVSVWMIDAVKDFLEKMGYSGSRTPFSG